MSLVALLLAAAAAAATAPSQGALWLGVQGELEVTDGVQLALSEEVRQEVLPSGETEALTEVSARVDLTGGVALEGSYRLGVFPGPAPMDLEHRLAADLRFDHRIGDIKLKARQRYTATFLGGTTHALRTRVGAELRLKPVRPYVAVEPFFRPAEIRWFHKVRFTLGARLPTDGPDLRLFTHYEHYRSGDRMVVLGLRASFGAKL